jgi:hypothetical protein
VAHTIQDEADQNFSAGRPSLGRIALKLNEVRR